jgi:hypothetical protein
MTERKIFTEVVNGETVKVAKRVIFTRMLNDENIKSNALYKELLEHEIELLDRKSANRTGGTKNTENVELAEKLYNLLKASNAETTIAEILQTSEFGIDKGFNSQKIVAIMKILVADNRVEKIVVKRKTYYKAI